MRKEERARLENEISEIYGKNEKGYYYKMVAHYNGVGDTVHVTLSQEQGKRWAREQLLNDISDYVQMFLVCDSLQSERLLETYIRRGERVVSKDAPVKPKKVDNTRFMWYNKEQGGMV